MYKAKNNLCPPYISDIFIKHRSKYNLRQSYFSAARYNTVWQALPSPLGAQSLGKIIPRLERSYQLKMFQKQNTYIRYSYTNG